MNLMDTRHGQKVDGRDASTLFTGAKTDWNDMAFIRSTSAGKPWLCAVSDRYKLVYSDIGDPWLFDLEKDPDEMINLFNEAASKKIVTTMTSQLRSYSKLQKDPYADLPQIKSAMDEVLGK
jgi:uncharacterized sulfatase